jgi:carnitine O-acetyltransferase
MLTALRLRPCTHRAIRTMSSLSPSVSNAARPANWKAAAPAAPPGTHTYAAQPTLPRLPVPPLADTARRLKETLRPLARHDAELAAAERAVDDLAGGALGKALQARLERRKEETEHWLEAWWDDGAYLGYRDSVVVNVSYFCARAPAPPAPYSLPELMKTFL